MNPYDQDQNQNNQNAQPPRRGTNIFTILLIGFLITVLVNWLFGSANTQTQIEYNQFLSLVEAGFVDQVQVEDLQINFTLKSDASAAAVSDILYPGADDDRQYEYKQSQLFFTGRIDDPMLVDRLLEQDVGFYQLIEKNSGLMSFVTSWILPMIFFYIILSLVGRSVSKRMGDGGLSGMMNTGKKPKDYNVLKSTGVTFADVAGQEEAKESLMELVDFLHNPEKYQKIGAKQPRGALLVGPPGTGKTLLAKAVAGEANVPFFSISGSEFVEMFVGLGAKRVRDLFEEAKKQAPCIIFIDEIDAIGKKRDAQLGSNDEREQTLNQLLAEMDGFDSSKGIVVLAATNRPESLDSALLRPGRFDRRIIVERPDLPGREAILKVHAAKVSLGPDVDLHEIALATSGATGADLANMVNEAALRAVRFDRHAVKQEDLMEAVEVVIAGKEKKDRIMNKKEREMVAYHEVGHALVTALQKHGTPVQKITIVPRTMGSLGYTMNMPEDERYLLTKSELMAEITTLLGGRAAEKLMFGEVTTGASNDIERATATARAMVTQYGMSDAFGPIGLESTQNQYLDGRNVLNCSEQTGAEIDKEVQKILEECQASADELLAANRAALERISKYLIEKENITGEQFMRLLEEVA